MKQLKFFIFVVCVRFFDLVYSFYLFILVVKTNETIKFFDQKVW